MSTNISESDSNKSEVENVPMSQGPKSPTKHSSNPSRDRAPIQTGNPLRGAPNPRDYGVEIFDGFKIKYPEYSVITPQTLHEFNLRTLTVQDEETLKSSMVTPNKLSEHLNTVIYNSIVTKPDHIVDYQTFLQNVTTKDRDALLYALYHVTYKDKHAYDVTCNKCKKDNSVKVDFSTIFKANMWMDDDNSILNNTIEVPLEIASDIIAVIKQPTLLDEKMITDNLKFASEEIRDTHLDLLIIDHFEINTPEAKHRSIIKSRDNILKGYKQLPATDKKMIEDAYTKNFGKYEIELKTSLTCQHCGAINEVEIDLLRQFFRTLYE